MMIGGLSVQPGTVPETSGKLGNQEKINPTQRSREKDHYLPLLMIDDYYKKLTC